MFPGSFFAEIIVAASRRRACIQVGVGKTHGILTSVACRFLDGDDEDGFLKTKVVNYYTIVLGEGERRML